MRKFVRYVNQIKEQEVFEKLKMSLDRLEFRLRND